MHVCVYYIVLCSVLCIVALSLCVYVCLCVYVYVYAVAFSQLTLEDVDSVSELGAGSDEASPLRRDIQPPRNLPMSYSSWLNQFNTNPYGPSSLAHLQPSGLASHIPAQTGRLSNATAATAPVVYAPPPPYNVVTADARVVVPGGCGSFYAACRSIKDPRYNHSHSGLIDTDTRTCFCISVSHTHTISVQDACRRTSGPANVQNTHTYPFNGPFCGTAPGGLVPVHLGSPGKGR